VSESELSPIQRALRARQQRMHESALELQRQVRRFQSNLEKIVPPDSVPAADASPPNVNG
jgi:hypothetical protein